MKQKGLLAKKKNISRRYFLFFAQWAPTCQYLMRHLVTALLTEQGTAAAKVPLPYLEDTSQ